VMPKKLVHLNDLLSVGVPKLGWMEPLIE
jgi:hypothetical protein